MKGHHCIVWHRVSNTHDDLQNYSGTEIDHGNDEDILQIDALLVKKFRNMVYIDFKKNVFEKKAVVPPTLPW